MAFVESDIQAYSSNESVLAEIALPELLEAATVLLTAVDIVELSPQSQRCHASIGVVAS